jgi:hypothetical protein
MKISKVTLIILGVVVLAVGFGVLYMMYSKQVQEQDSLKATIKTNQARLAQLVSEQEKWKSQLTVLQEQIAQKNQEVAAARSSLDTAKTAWPASAESIEYEERIFALADGWDLVVNVVTAGNTATTNINGINFTTNTFTVTVTGSPLAAGFDEEDKYQEYIYKVAGDILSFLDEIVRNDFFASAKMDVVSLTIPSLLTKADLVNTGTEIEQPVGTLSITVYTY